MYALIIEEITMSIDNEQFTAWRVYVTDNITKVRRKKEYKHTFLHYFRANEYCINNGWIVVNDLLY